MIWLYNIALSLLAPVWVPWMWWRTRARQEKPNWKQRFGEITTGFERDRPVIWLHAVSVGEVAAAIPVLRELRAQSPLSQILLTTTTSTGQQTARSRALEAGLADCVAYFPIDVARFMWAATWRVRPHAVAIMETELWFNFLQFSKEVGAATLLINGRISDRSFPRSMKLRFFYKALLGKLDHGLMQTVQDAERLSQLGAREVEVVGNTKFDEIQPPDPETRERWRTELGIESEDVLIVVGSTRGEEEEAFVLAALVPVLRPGLKIIHAPRHIEGAEALEARVRAITPRLGRRSRGETTEYLILDSYGELGEVYSAADIAIVGGGFANLGGQNIIQPMAAGVPVVHGPHMHNFRDVADAAGKARASLTVSSPAELTEALRALIDNPSHRQTIGQKGQELVRKNQGASATYAHRILASAQPAFELEQAQRAKRANSAAQR